MTLQELQDKTRRWATGEEVEFPEFLPIVPYQRTYKVHWVPQCHKIIKTVYVPVHHGRWELLDDEEVAS